MTVQTYPKQHTTKTTTLVVEQPQDYALLEAHFRLVRYLIPDALRYRGNPNDFGRIHNRLSNKKCSCAPYVRCCAQVKTPKDGDGEIAAKQ